MATLAGPLQRRRFLGNGHGPSRRRSARGGRSPPARLAAPDGRRTGALADTPDLSPLAGHCQRREHAAPARSPSSMRLMNVGMSTITGQPLDARRPLARQASLRLEHREMLGEPEVDLVEGSRPLCGSRWASPGGRWSVARASRAARHSRRPPADLARGRPFIFAYVLSRSDSSSKSTPCPSNSGPSTQAKRIAPSTVTRHPPHMPVPSTMIGLSDTIVRTRAVGDRRDGRIIGTGPAA